MKLNSIYYAWLGLAWLGLAWLGLVWFGVKALISLRKALEFI
ncbi:hypothetical protein ACE34V_003217 [Vibrio alginolyticus]